MERVEEGSLLRLHLGLFGWGSVIEPHQMKGAMNQQEEDLFLKSPGDRQRHFFGKSEGMVARVHQPSGALHADHQVAEFERWASGASALTCGKGEHVRSGVDLSPLEVVVANLLIVREERVGKGAWARAQGDEE